MGITLASLSLSGKIPELILLFIIEAIHVVMVSPQCFVRQSLVLVLVMKSFARGIQPFQ